MIGTATTASAAEFTKIEVAYNPYFGSLLIEIREQNIKPGTRVRIVISAAERFKYQCQSATDQKYFIHDHLVIDFEEHANDQGRYRAVFDVGRSGRVGSGWTAARATTTPTSFRSAMTPSRCSTSTGRSASPGPTGSAARSSHDREWPRNTESSPRTMGASAGRYPLRDAP